MKVLTITLTPELRVNEMRAYAPARTFTYEAEQITVTNANGMLMFNWPGTELAYRFQEVVSYQIKYKE